MPATLHVLENRTTLNVGENTVAAVAAATLAQASAATALVAAGPNYASIAAGNAATSVGQYFAVDNGDQTISVYAHGAASSADALRKFPKDTLGVFSASTGAQKVGLGDTTLADATIITPFQKGAVLAGLGDSTTALQAFLDAVGDGVNGRWAGGPYEISSRLQLLNKSNFHISGRCTITMVAGAPDATAYDNLLVQGCTNFTIEGLKNDGNRYNRTPKAGGGCCFRIVNSHRGKFRDCEGTGAPTDGWYLRGSDVNDIATYPTDITLEDCKGQYSARNGVSLVGAVRPKIIRGRYGFSQGFSPEGGIDSEPNSNDIYGVVDPLFDKVEVHDNYGSGLIITGNTGSAITSGARIHAVNGSNNRGIARYTTTFTVSGVTTSPTVNAVYTDANGAAFIVTAVSITSGAGTISATGSAAPASGILTKASGTGDASIAFSASSVAAAAWGGALLHLGASKNPTVESSQSGDHPNFAPGSITGIIEIESNALGVNVKNCDFADITVGGNACCVHGDGALGAKVKGIRARNIACCAVVFAATDSELVDVKIDTSTYAGICISGSGSRNKFGDFVVDGHAAGTYAGYFTGSYHVVRDLLAISRGAADTFATNGAWRFDSSCTNADIDGLRVHAVAAVPTGNVARIDAAPIALRNVKGTKEAAATGSWTTSNLIFSANGLFAPTIMSGMSPDVLSGSATVDQPSIAAGASITPNISVAKASVGDRAIVTPPASLGGLILTVPAVSTNGRVDYVLTNPTASAIDLASGTWKASVVKS